MHGGPFAIRRGQPQSSPACLRAPGHGDLRGRGKADRIRAAERPERLMAERAGCPDEQPVCGVANRGGQPWRQGDGERPGDRLGPLHLDQDLGAPSWRDRNAHHPAARGSPPPVLPSVLRYHDAAAGDDVTGRGPATGGQPDGHLVGSRGHRPGDPGPGARRGLGALAQPRHDQADHHQRARRGQEGNAPARRRAATAAGEQDARPGKQGARHAGTGERRHVTRGGRPTVAGHASPQGPAAPMGAVSGRTPGQACAFPLTTPQSRTFCLLKRVRRAVMW